MMVAQTLDLNRRQVLVGVAAGCAASALPLPSLASAPATIRYDVMYTSAQNAVPSLQVLRGDVLSVSQLVLVNDDHVFILRGAIGGNGGLRLEL